MMISKNSFRALSAALVATLFLVEQATAQCPGPDIHEPNGTCSQAAPLTEGLQQANILNSADEDYFHITIPAGAGFDLQSVSDDWGGIVDLAYSLRAGPSCTDPVVATEFGWFTVAHLGWFNDTGSDVTATLRVYGYSYHDNSDCVNYWLDIVVVSPTCATTNGDAYESNEQCAQAAIVVDGVHSGLHIGLGLYDRDYYKLAVQDGETLAVDIEFEHAASDLQLYLKAGLEQCFPGTGSVAAGLSSTDNESVVWVNDTGYTWTCFIEVAVAGTPPAGCGLYSMHIARFDTAVGTPLCFGDGTAEAGGAPVDCPCGNVSVLGEGCRNGTGQGAILTTTGSSSVANDDLVFVMSQAAPNQPSMLLQGATLIATPFKDGILCTGNPTRRMEVVFLDVAGAGNTVQSIVSDGNISPGQTRYYQVWFRDPLDQAPCTARSNLTHALEIFWN